MPLGPRSKELFERAKRVLPGGVNSPVRAMKPYPFFAVRGKGSRIYDVDGNEYIDYCLAYGPLILGHAHPRVVEAVREQLDKGSVYGTPTEVEILLAEKIVKHVPCAEMVRFVNSGTEATMSAIRLARGYTGRKKIIKFEGAFHGAHDYVLVKAGSGVATMGVASSLGIPEETVRNTIVLPFNNEEAVERVVEEQADEIAAIILEPVIGNAGCILPKDGYLEFLRRITREYEILLIFDEVITGFRLAMGGAQEYFGVIPDLVTLGKILGGGFPIGAFAGRREIMEMVSPSGKVYNAGTFNGNPISMTAGLATIETLEKEPVIQKTSRYADELRKAISDMITDMDLRARLYGIASMFQIYFTDEEVVDYETASRSDKELFLRFQLELLNRGVFFPPSQFECNFVSYAHTEEDFEKTVEAIEDSLKAVFGK